VTLSREDEARLFVTNPQALVTANIGLAKHLAAKFARSSEVFDELVQEGCEAMLDSLSTFDPAKSAFGTYVGTAIRRRIWIWLRARGLVYIPDSASVVRSRIAIAKGLATKPEDLIACGVSSDRCDDVFLAITARTVGHEKRFADGDVSEWLAGPHDVEGAVADAQEAAALRATIEACLAKIDAREADVLRRRYLSDEPAVLQDLADEYGVSRQRVHQIEAIAIRRLRAALGASNGGRVSLHRISPEKRATIERMFAEGYSLATINRRLGLGRNAAGKVVKGGRERMEAA